MLQHAVCWLEKRVQNGTERTTVDHVIKFSAYLFATNKIKTIVKMREKERKRERAAACGTPCQRQRLEQAEGSGCGHCQLISNAKTAPSSTSSLLCCCSSKVVKTARGANQMSTNTKGQGQEERVRGRERVSERLCQAIPRRLLSAHALAICATILCLFALPPLRLSSNCTNAATILLPNCDCV